MTCIVLPRPVGYMSWCTTAMRGRRTHFIGQNTTMTLAVEHVEPIETQHLVTLQFDAFCNRLGRVDNVTFERVLDLAPRGCLRSLGQGGFVQLGEVVAAVGIGRRCPRPGEGRTGARSNGRSDTGLTQCAGDQTGPDPHDARKFLADALTLFKDLVHFVVRL